MSGAVGVDVCEAQDSAAVERVQARLAVVCGQTNALHGEMVELAAEALESGLWAQAGVHSPAQWLAWQTGLSPARARQIAKIAERRADLPVTIAALRAGALSVDQVVVIARYAPAHIDAEVCELARSVTVWQLSRSLARYRPTREPQPSRDGRCRFSGTDDGGFQLHGHGPAEEGKLIETALAEAKDALFRQGRTDVDWWDALVAVCQRSLDRVKSKSRRERYRILVHLDAEGATWSDGTALSDPIRQLLCCDSSLTPVWYRDGLPVSVGRSQRNVPDRTRFLVQRRDRGCRVPGCTMTRYLDCHHIVWWENGGRTDLENLVCLCKLHHRLHHLGLLGISGNPNDQDGLVFTARNGRVIAPTGRPTLPTGPPPEPAEPYHHPTGERLYEWSVTFNDPPEVRARIADHADRVRKLAHGTTALAC